MTTHLVTLGLTDAQREILADVEGTFVEVDLRTSKTPDEYLLDVVDAAADHPDTHRVIVLVGPLAFGFACSGQIKPLGEWAAMNDLITLAVCPDRGDAETYALTSEAYMRVRADLGIALDVGSGLSWLLGRLAPHRKDTSS